MKKIAFVNQKGGVGKTTSLINVGAGLSLLGKKILAVDLDPQACLTYSLGFEPGEVPYNVYNYLKGEVAFSDVALEKEGFLLIPSGIQLAVSEMEFAGVRGKEKMLVSRLADELDNFDYLLIDCPPSLGFLTINALCTALEVYVPIQTEILSLQGVSQLLNTVKSIRKKANPHLDITGVIATRYDARKKLNKEVLEILLEQFGKKLFRAVIRENVSLAEAPSWGGSIFAYKPKSYGAEDYMSLCHEIVKRR